ncbi:hypothetical protein EVAR_72552_1 [Eumeta japonica]|uniref:Uncharacterized protein n=1 Tax=Eumeta variegata TaxID=151549 RepID=A0A4C1SBM9_EUMVA|nr:hypothetical protein EVAR_72552_1 [Eumeta japonica]
MVWKLIAGSKDISDNGINAPLKVLYTIQAMGVYKICVYIPIRRDSSYNPTSARAKPELSPDTCSPRTTLPPYYEMTHAQSSRNDVDDLDAAAAGQTPSGRDLCYGRKKNRDRSACSLDVRNKREGDFQVMGFIVSCDNSEKLLKKNSRHNRPRVRLTYEISTFARGSACVDIKRILSYSTSIDDAVSHDHDPVQLVPGGLHSTEKVWHGMTSKNASPIRTEDELQHRSLVRLSQR